MIEDLPRQLRHFAESWERSGFDASLLRTSAADLDRLRSLVGYLAEFAAEQGADFGLWADAGEITEAQHWFLREVTS